MFFFILGFIQYEKGDLVWKIFHFKTHIPRDGKFCKKGSTTGGVWIPNALIICVVFRFIIEGVSILVWSAKLTYVLRIYIQIYTFKWSFELY